MSKCRNVARQHDHNYISKYRNVEMSHVELKEQTIYKLTLLIRIILLKNNYQPLHTMKQMFVIYGQQDSGKTHAMWLLLSYLLENGAELQDLFHAERPFTTREIFATKEQMTDFRALVRWNGASIMLLSAGDYLENADWGFRKRMKEAEEANIDYFVCCAREEGTPVYNEIKKHYEGNVLSDNGWELLYKQPEEADWMLQSDETAWHILRKLHRAIKPNVPANYPKHALRHQRFLFPVGQGGFAFERIDNCNVLFDCGSHTSPTRLKMYIDTLCDNKGVTQIDYLFISHFDEDHVNGIRMLLDTGVRIQNAVMSYIPENLRVVYDIITKGAYTAIRDILRENENRAEIIEIGRNEGEQTNGRTFNHNHDVWEWIAKSMLKDGDFEALKNKLIENELDVQRLSDPAYLAPRTDKINKAYKEAFGSRGPNATGLIMLSQRTAQTAFAYGDIENDCCCFCEHYYWHHGIREYRSEITDKTSCLYVGDAMLKSEEQVSEIESFLNAHRSEKALLLVQLPHHGSKYNINPNLHQRLTADFYFVCYQSDEKIKKVTDLYDDLTKSKQLLMIRDICSDLVINNSFILP